MFSYWLLLHARMVSRDGERGDVPGWVLITVMTATIVSLLWAFAGPKLTSMLQDAINSVHG
jgi:hypothetical protein